MTKDHGKPNHFMQWRNCSRLSLLEATIHLGLHNEGELWDIEYTKSPAPTDLIIKMIKLYKVKILSVRQPWANWLTEGLKTIEIRSRNSHYRGPLLIHSSQKPDKNILEFKSSSARAHLGFEINPRGCIIGSVDLIAVKKYFTRHDWHVDRPKHYNPISWYKNGLHGLILNNAKKLPEPIPVNGKLGLWKWKG
jgi:hypothetical protein